MVEKIKHQKIWSDKETVFNGAFQEICGQKEIYTYKTESETKSAFAERNIQSLTYFVYKYLEHKWTYHHSNKFQSFFGTVNTPVSCVTNLGPNKNTRKQVPPTRAIQTEKSQKFGRKPRFQVGDRVPARKD